MFITCYILVLKQNKLILAKEKTRLISTIRELNFRETRYNKSSVEFVSNYERYDIAREILSIRNEIDNYDKKTFFDINLIYKSSIYLMPKDRLDLSGNKKNKIINLHTTAKKGKIQKKFIKGKQQSNHIIRADSSSNIKDSKMKHLNSTDFTSNCSEIYYSIINNNNSNNSNIIQIESILNINKNTSNSSKHLRTKINMNVNMKKNTKESKDSKLIDSIDSHTQKSFYKKAKKPVRDLDNIKVIKIKARKCFPSKNKNKNNIDLRSNNNIINRSHNNHYNVTARKHTTTFKSTDKCQTISSLKESSSVQNFALPLSFKADKIK